MSITSRFDRIDLARLISTAAPHLNGKVERSQRTDRMEFWATIDNTAPKELLEEQLAQWQGFYNQQRTHSAIHCKTPYARFQELIDVLPTHEAVQAAYITPQKKISLTIATTGLCPTDYN